MKIQSFEFAYIKSFKSLVLDLDRTVALIGQNDHGKSSILKALDIVLNQLDESALALGALHPDLAEKLLPIFPVNAKARRVTLNCEEGGQKRQLHFTVRADLSFTVHDQIKRNVKTSQVALDLLRKIREQNKFVLIPALRDASSESFQALFTRLLRQHGLAKMIPQKAGGTPKEYRTLKDIREQITGTIRPYINKTLLPEIEKHFGFTTQHPLALKFDIEVQDIGEWILNNLRLGFRLTNDEQATIALSEAGSGVQSAVLLALHRLEQSAAENPEKQFLLAIEEPEAFLHPQKQKELYEDIRKVATKNLKILVTTHSPYIVSEIEFSRFGFVKKHEQYSALHVPNILNTKEREIFDAYSNEVNSALFFADKVIFVEGESDQVVIKVLLQKKFGATAHRYSIISAAGNRNFSPFLRMIKAWTTAKIPHLVVTDFDSLTTSTERAVIVGAKAAGYAISGELGFHAKIDGALDKGEPEFEAVAKEATSLFLAAGLNVFVFSSDLENALITASAKDVVSKILSEESPTGVDYSKGYDLNQLRRVIGSKGIPLNPIADPAMKKPYIHRKIARSIDLGKAHRDLNRLLVAIESLGT